MPIPVFDAHCDTIYVVQKKGATIRKNSYHIDLERGQSFSPYAQIFAVFTRPDTPVVKAIDYSQDLPQEELKRLGEGLLKLLLSELDSNSDIILLCRDAKDARTAASQSRIAAFIAVEGSELLGCDEKRLEHFYKQGVRFINLCWNYDNAVCGAAYGREKGGLTELGRSYVVKMQELGIAVDLSHASERTFWDTAEITKKPIIAGHSNSKKICDNLRNISDEQFREIVRLGGVVGLNLCQDFLNESKSAKIDDVIRHAEHFLELGGEKTLCLGGDLDGVDTLPYGITGIESYGDIYEAMLKHGYTEDLVCDIFYNNLFDVLERVL